MSSIRNLSLPSDIAVYYLLSLDFQIIDVAKEVYHGGEPRSIDSYTVTVGGLD